MHFIHCSGPDFPLLGTVIGPFDRHEVSAVIIVRTAQRVKEDLQARRRGELVPGRPPVTSEDYRYRLEAIAKALARCEAFTRRLELEAQFDEVADQICLAKSKRRWIILEAIWSLRSNAPATIEDLWGEKVASPSCLMRPRLQDFHPDPQVRRRRTQLPEHVRTDPLSINNMLRAFQAEGLKARITRLGDPTWDRGSIQIDLTMKGRARFHAEAVRDDMGTMRWQLSWDGNYSRAGQRRLRAAMQREEYRLLKGVIAVGLSGALRQTP
jgi:hypothetical protein